MGCKSLPYDQPVLVFHKPQSGSRDCPILPLTPYSNVMHELRYNFTYGKARQGRAEF